MQFTFTTRDEYFQQKAEWFKEYEEQVRLIRNLKHLYKVAQRESNSVDPIMRTQRKAHETMQKLIADRAESRLEAGRQYMKRHALI